MAIKRLPNGKLYDTVKRVIIDEPVENIRNPPPIYVPRRRNAWQRADDYICSIGYWFKNKADFVADQAVSVVVWLFGIGLAISVIGVWIDSGFWKALLTAFILGAIGLIIIGIFAWFDEKGIIRLLLYIPRLIFYNIWTLLLVIAIVIGVVCFSNRPYLSKIVEQPAQASVSLQPNYYCDVASTLNVREQPNSNARKIGLLKSREEVYVHSIDKNNFAKIDFKGSIAYVSADYLKPKGATAVTANSIKQNNYTETAQEAVKNADHSDISATISNVWMEHNVYQNEQKGLGIHLKFHTYNMQTIQGQCIVYFYHEDGTALKDNNNSCRTANGNVAIGEYFIPDRKENVYEDFSLFIPYNELHLSDERKTNLKANVILWTSSPSQQAKQLAVSDWFYFWYGSQN